MQFKVIATVLVSSLVFSGCSLLPGQSEESAVQDAAVTQQAPAAEMMENDTAEMENGENVMDATVTDEMMAADTAQMADAVQLNMSNFTFGVEEIKVKAGEKLVVSVTNDSGVHDFVIDELAVDSGIIPEGETMEIEIPTDKPGTYEYYCSVGQHRDMGMKGTLIIE